MPMLPKRDREIEQVFWFSFRLVENFHKNTFTNKKSSLYFQTKFINNLTKGVTVVNFRLKDAFRGFKQVVVQTRMKMKNQGKKMKNQNK